MVKIASHSFVDFALADAVDTRVRADSQVELASRNLFSNPDMRDIDSDGSVEGVELLSGPVPSGRHIYVRWLKDAAGVAQRDTRLTRQNSNTVDLDATYPLNEPIVEGTEPQDASRRSKLPRLPAPEVEVVATGKAGFAAGYYGIAVCGVTGNPRRSHYMRFTTPGPVATVNVGQGNYIRVFLPQPAEGYSGLAILATEGKATATEAANAPLYFQRILDARRRIRSPYPLVGPLKTRVRAHTTNTTYEGAFGQWPAPRYGYGPGGPFTLHPFTSRLTYQVRTAAGESADQQVIDVDTTAKAGPGRALYVYLPRNARKMFRGATEWRLKFEGPDGLWYSEDWQPFGTRARMQTNDPEGYHPSNKPEQTGRVREDATGVPAPDADLESPEAFGKTLPLPGTYAVREALEEEGDDSKEGPPSPATTVTIAQGQYFRVKPPAVGNRLPNAELADKDPASGDPMGWTLIRDTANNVFVSGVNNRIGISDTSNLTTNAQLFATPAVRVGPQIETLRVLAAVTSYTSGQLQVRVRFLDSAGNAFSGSPVPATLTSVSTVDMEVTVGPAGSGADYEWPAGTVSAAITGHAIGSTPNGARNFGANLRHFGSFRGLAAPRKRPAGMDVVDAAEDAAASYHPGPYSVALDNPADRHADLAGVTLNVVEYYASYGTQPSADNLLAGYRTPVNGGQTYTPSLYAGWRGVSVPTELLEAVVKDAEGNTLQTLGPLITGVSGTSADARRVAPSFTAHADAAYFEIVGGGGSDGRVRVYGFQLDAGTLATAYTNENALTGTVTVTLDTQTPGSEIEVTMGWLSVVKEWVNASIISTEAAATSTSYRFRTSDDLTAWSAWTTDFAVVPKLRYWQIEATLNTTDATQSPLVSWMGLELLRPRTLLLRPDGSEYPGGVQALDVSAPHPLPIFETILSDSNVSTRRSRGNPRDERSMDLQAYLDEAIELIHEDIATGEPLVIESTDLERRLGVIVEPPEFSVDREDRPHTAERPLPWYHDSNGVSFEVVSEEPL